MKTFLRWFPRLLGNLFDVACFVIISTSIGYLAVMSILELP